MAFVASKILWFLVQPTFVMGTLILAGAGLLRTRWKRLGGGLVGVVAVVLAVLVVVPLDGHARWMLETRFDRPEVAPDQVDTIVVLGGAENLAVSVAWGWPEVGGSADRLIAGAAMLRRYPEAVLMHSGGSGLLGEAPTTESAVAAEVWEILGVDTTALLLEEQSRNTFESAQLSFTLRAPDADHTWLLITSASHMPRAIASFRQAGWPEPVPWPVDRHMAAAPAVFDLTINPVRRLAGLEGPLHEMIGLVAYRMMGRTESVWPSPREPLA